MGMENILSGLLLVILCAASLAAWNHALQAARQGTSPLFPLREPAPPCLPRRALVVGGACLMLFLLDPLLDLSRWLQGEPPPAAAGGAKLADVQLQCGINLLLWGALLATLGSRPEEWRAQGIFLQPLARQTQDAVFGFHLAIGPVFLTLFASLAVGLRGATPEHQLLKMLLEDGTAINWFWIALTAVVAAPLLEELLFRVLLQGALAEWLPSGLAVWISSLLFCVVHKFPDSLALLPLAVVLGMVQLRRRSYVTVVLIHAIFNAVNLLLTALSPSAPA